MKFVTPAAEELSYLRPDPLLWEQELDVRPAAAKALERIAGKRAGRVYWRSTHNHLYALELADSGRALPSMAMVYGFWDRFEPRPPEHEIDADLLYLSRWMAELVEGMDPTDVDKVARFAGVTGTWPQGSVVRTPEERFQSLPGFPYEPNYLEVEGLRLAYVDEPATGTGTDLMLLLHGEPTWGYLYRHMIPILTRVGRVVVPDLIGFGRSDKPVAANAYSYKSHVRWLRRFIEGLDLRNVTLVCQDWGGSLGLRILSQMPDRFSRLVAMNTGIGDGRGRSDAFMRWRRFSQRVEMLDLPLLMRNTLKSRVLDDAEADAYGAPFPLKEFQMGALVFPRLVPIRLDHPGAYDNRVAIEALKQLELPVLLPWGAEDEITAPAEKHLRSIFRNVAPPISIKGAGHFIQEDAGEEVAELIVEWMAGEKVPSA